MSRIELGKTQTAVRILHAKRNILYFVENFFDQTVTSPQRNLIMKLEKTVKIEKYARKICREKCKDFGNKAAVDYLVDDQWQEWIEEAKEVIRQEVQK